ncbi:MAG TPA: lysyl oxidase family protein, partial [Polyangiaceae bacterium]
GRDCNGDCDGEAYLDTCRRCVGGNTGREPSSPSACPTGPDILVDAQYLRGTIEEAVVDVPTNSCLVNERCVTGTGRRRVVRFGTRIANVGNRDVATGAPGPSNPLWTYDACHGHYHFANYADYDLIDVRTSTPLPIGTKNGFCMLDLETWDPELAVNGCSTYDCNNQGISVGCADVYDSSLQCQWVDITGIASGEYDLRVTANPDRVISELDYENNVATVRIAVSDTAVTLVP